MPFRLRKKVKSTENNVQSSENKSKSIFKSNFKSGIFSISERTSRSRSSQGHERVDRPNSTGDSENIISLIPTNTEESDEFDISIFSRVNVISEELSSLSEGINETGLVNVFLGNYDSNNYNESAFYSFGAEFNNFNFSTLSDLISKSRKNDKKNNFQVLSHEVLKIQKKPLGRVETNLLFFSENSLENETFINLRRNEIDKYESTADRFFEYIPLETHSDLIQESYDETTNIFDVLDDITTINNKLEKDINYGNIVEDFIKNGNSIYNGKILNRILTDQKDYLSLTGNSDKYLLDKQDRNFISKVKKSDLELFYKNISGFDFSEINTDFANSVLNFKILNTDRVVGQLLVNMSIAQNSLYPNTDNIQSLEYFNSRARINSNAMNRYPIIQVFDINSNSRIFNKSNSEIIGVNGKRLNISKVQLGVDSNFINSNFHPVDIDALLDGNLSILTRGLVPIDQIRNEKVKFRNKKSIAGKENTAVNQRYFNNNIIDFQYTLRESESRVRPRDLDYEYERILIDADTKSDNFLSNSFVMFPSRYFLANFFLDALGDFTNNREISSNVGNPRNLSLDQLRRGLSPGDQTKSLLFNNFSGLEFLESDRNLGINTLNSMKIFYNDHLLKFLNIKYEKLYNGIENQQNYEFSLGSTSQDELTDTNLSFDLDKFFYSRLEFIREDNISTGIERLLNEDVFQDSNIFSISENISNEISGVSKFNELENDCFVYCTSNSILSDSDLYNISTTYSRNSQHEYKDLNNIKYVKSNNEKLLNKDNTTSHVKEILENKYRIDKLVLLISSSVNEIKKNLSSEFNKFYDILSKVKNKVAQKEKFTLLYDKFEETSLDTFEKSKFILNSEFYINNFTEEFSDIKNTTSLVLDSESNIESNHLFTSKEYREYLSKIYTKSFLRNKTTMFNRLLTDVVDIFKKSNYRGNRNFSFDVLLAHSFVNRNNNDSDVIRKLCRLILSNAIAKLAGIDNQISLLKDMPNTNIFEGQKASATSNYKLKRELDKIYSAKEIDEIISLIFSKKNIHSEKGYILRSIKPNELSSLDSFNITASNGLGGVNFKHVPGYMCELVFPMGAYCKDFTNSSLSSDKISNLKELGSEFTGQENVNIESFKSYTANFFSFLSNSFYNYDNFINEEQTGISFYDKDENNLDVNSDEVLKGFTYNENNTNKGIELRLTRMLYDNVSYGKSDIFKQVTDENGITSTIFNIDVKIPYTGTNWIIPFSYFYLADQKNTFSEKITNFAIDLLKIFNVNFENISNINDALSFIDENQFYLKIMQDTYEAFSNIFLQNFDNYKIFIVDKIRRKSLESDLSFEDFKSYVENEYSFSNGNSENKAFAVSDLKEILKLNEDSLEEINYQEGDRVQSYTYNSIGSSQFSSLQVVNKLLKNSDISDAICHDIIHGYFANLEDNIENEKENEDNLLNSINIINSKVSSYINKEVNLKDNLLDEFYQNTISKSLQEAVFYKNVYNEVFIKNNLFNSLKEKYNSVNIFNHRKLYYENQRDKALFGMQYISDTVINETDTSNIDIIKIPISFEEAKKIGTRGILKISILPVNLKYPEIEYAQIDFYYSPSITEVSCNFTDDLESDFFNFVGFYNDTQKISERYSVVPTVTAIEEAKNLFNDIFIRRAEAEGTRSAEALSSLSEKLISDAKLSSAVKAINFMSQSHIDEKVAKKEFKVFNVISKKSKELIENLNIDQLNKVFDNFDENIFNISDSEFFSLGSENNILKNDEFYKKFILNLDKDISESDMFDCMIPTVFYDTFNVVLNRDRFRKIDTDEEINFRSENILSPINEDINKCFNYYLEISVL